MDKRWHMIRGVFQALHIGRDDLPGQLLEVVGFGHLRVFKFIPSEYANSGDQSPKIAYRTLVLKGPSA